MLVSALLGYIVKRGRLTVIDAHGRRHSYGPGPAPDVTIRLHDPGLHWKLYLGAPLLIGEAYMDGRLTVEDGQIEDFLGLLLMNIGSGPPTPVQGFLHSLRRLGRRLQQYNPAPRARRNVAHHYDLSGALYDLFLDSDRQYSCAYFAGPADTLETAQLRKKRHIAGKLRLSPGQRVLDIGSGWGGLALTLAAENGCDVTGVTLSEEQLKVATDRAVAAGLAGRVRFALQDYRAQTGVFDRIVSVGMFEHVGVTHYPAFFAKLRDLLADDGVALLHTIGRSDGPGVTSPWIRKYIFPGGYTPALSEVLPVIERAGLIVTDIEVWRLHYAETLKEWRRRFRVHWHEIAALYDERFCRMWEFYLAGAEMGFRHQGLVVYQIQLARRIDSLPLTRDYMLDAERTQAMSPSRPGRAA